MREIHLDSVDSTNSFAKQHSADFPRDQITCISADEQTAGRGRHQRKWFSFKGAGLYVTFYFTLSIRALHIGSLAQLMALSFAKILIQEGLTPQIKWPNDVRLHHKKISGVLCETQFHPEYVDIFLGIGINVNLDQKSADLIDQPATSLLIETGKNWDQQQLLKALQTQFTKDLELFKKDGFSPFQPQFEHLLALKGQTLQVNDGQKVWTGVFHSLTKEGKLNLILADDTIHTISSGDVYTRSSC